MEREDEGIRVVRETRVLISRACGDDPAALVRHYVELQAKYANRLIDATSGRDRQVMEDQADSR